MRIADPVDVVVARPFKTVVIKPKLGSKGRPRRALQLNTERVVDGMTYQQVLIPYTPEEMAARRMKSRLVAPMLPDKPGVEGIDYGARPQRMSYHKCGHLQFVRSERIAASAEEKPWAG
jgi:hypothetical protein